MCLRKDGERRGGSAERDGKDEPDNDVFVVGREQRGNRRACIGRLGGGSVWEAGTVEQGCKARRWHKVKTLEVGAWSLAVAWELWRWLGRQGRFAPSTRLSDGDEEGDREGEGERQGERGGSSVGAGREGRGKGRREREMREGAAESVE